MEHFAWPTAVAGTILGIVFLILFRRPITGILDRTKKISKGGLEMSDSPQQPEETAKSDPLAEFMTAYDNPLLKDREGRILADLDVRGLKDLHTAQTALVRELAGTQLRLHFEQVENLIWGAQVAALIHLNSRPAPVPAEEIRPLYDEGARRFPEMYKQHPFDGWLNFLIGQDLVERKDGQISLTLIGREFLKWRIEAKRAGPFHG